jgi:hypothetical protein
MARQSRQANARDQDRQHMPRHTEKAHETLGLTGETQIVALADFHGRFDNHHQPWWVWALTGQARYEGAEMNFFVRFNGSEGFHEGALNVQSNGCIHMSRHDAEWIYRNVPAGTPVHIRSR